MYNIHVLIPIAHSDNDVLYMGSLAATKTCRIQYIGPYSACYDNPWRRAIDRYPRHNMAAFMHAWGGCAGAIYNAALP